MTQQLACPECSTTIAFEEQDAGKTIRCEGCSTRLEPRQEEAGDLRFVRREPPVASGPSERRARRERISAEAARRRAVILARGTLLVLALLAVIGGLYLGLRTAEATEETIARLRESHFEGETYTLPTGEEVGLEEFVESARWEARVALYGPLGLAALYLALFLWSLRSPLPALVTALGIYLLLAALEGFADPSLLLQGLLLKLLVVFLLLRGVRAARAERAERSLRPIDTEELRRVFS